MLPLLAAGIGGLSKSGIFGKVGGVIHNLGSAFGLGGPSNTDPAARKLQDDLTPYIIGTKEAGYKNGGTDPGVYVIDRRNGNVYASKKDGLHAISTPWTKGITADWLTKNPLNTASLNTVLATPATMAAARAGISPGLLIVAVAAGLGVLLFAVRK